MKDYKRLTRKKEITKCKIVSDKRYSVGFKQIPYKIVVNILKGVSTIQNDMDGQGDYVTGDIVDKIADLEDKLERGEIDYVADKDKEIDRLTAENKQLTARLENAVILPCKVGNKAWFIFVAGKQSVIVESVIAQIKLTDRAIIVELGNSGRYLVFDYNGNLKENNYEIYLEYTKAKARLAEIKAEAKLKEIKGVSKSEV